MTGTDAEFGWRREAPWIVLCALTGLVVRLLTAQHGEVLMDADTGILGLMARDIWNLERFPLFFYGNNYMGATSVYLMAPFYGLLGADVRVVGYGQAVWFALLVAPPMYRLFHLLGRRRGAVVATLLFAIGTPDQLTITGAKLFAYLDLVGLGALLYVVALPRLGHWTGRGALLVGLVAGFSWFTNPQIASFFVALALGWWLLSSRTARLIAGELPGAPERTRRRVRTLAYLAGAAGLVSLVAALHPFAISLGPFTLSLQKGDNYLRRIAALSAVIICYYEWRLAPDRKAVVRTGACGAFGVVLGVTPLVAFYALQTPFVMKPLTALKMKLLWTKGPEVCARMMTSVLGPGRLDGSPALELLHQLLYLLTLAGLVLAAAWLLYMAREPLGRLVTLRSGSPSNEAHTLIVFSQLPLLVLLIGSYPLPLEPRYFVPAIVPVGALVAWTLGQLVRGRALAAAAPLLLTVALGTGHWLFVELPAATVPPRHQVLDYLAKHGLRHGYAEYFKCYEFVFLSDEALAMRVFTHNVRNGGDRMPWLSQRILDDRPEQLFVLFRTSDRDTPDLLRRFRRHYASVIEGEKRIGEYLVIRFRRPRRLHVEF